uniref:Putative ixostatin n=1 Tax=Ixodes ricinus TaxID=34613 RepID=A0A0K8R4S7_IXORI
MQLTLFIVFVTFVHLSCEEQSEASPDIFREMTYLSTQCKANLKEQLVERCGEHRFQTQLVDISGCHFKCGEEHNNGQTRVRTSQEFKLNDGTPCGQGKVCIDGTCIETCRMPVAKQIG